MRGEALRGKVCHGGQPAHTTVLAAGRPSEEQRSSLVGDGPAPPLPGGPWALRALGPLRAGGGGHLGTGAVSAPPGRQTAHQGRTCGPANTEAADSAALVW